MASISVRQSIRWPPAPASEPTSTVVLTSPGRRFVDVRLRLPEPPPPPTPENWLFRGLLLPLSAERELELEWAFAGTSSSEPCAAPGGPGDITPAASRSMWRHWVDSRHAQADKVADEGVCVAQPDGTVLESGEMTNPATGVVGPYEELWRDAAPAATVAGSSVVRCVVLQLQDEASGDRGMVQRLGQFCQGVARTAADGLTVERWQWTQPAGWRRVFRNGDGELPCPAATDDEQALLQERAVVQSGRCAWTVVEAAEV